MVKDSREQRIVDNLALVHAVANRFRSRGADYEDLFQAGCIGLIKAVDRFDESLGYQFSTYAVPVIMGEIRRIFRDGGPVKVSRSLKDKSIRVNAVREQFIRAHEREPSLSELSALTETDTDTLCEILNILSPVISLDEEDDEGKTVRDVPVNADDEMMDRLSLSEAFSALDSTELRLLRYRYFEGKTQCETAKLLDISQVQVSRRERKALLKMRHIME